MSNIAKAMAFGVAILVFFALVPAYSGAPPPEPARNISRLAVRPVPIGPTVVAVGDIACAPGHRVTARTCQHAATARLTGTFSPYRVLLLGDEQYERGEEGNFNGVFDKSWGQFKSITLPVPGNHEYKTPGARGYYKYFGRSAPGRYVANIGTWKVYALNSNCDKIDCAAQARWLDTKMSASPTTCSMIMMHHPRYSSGDHGDNPAVRGLWRVALRHHADIALSGHDHSYERFKPMNADGAVSATGIQLFVSGTGGKSLYPRKRHHVGSMAWDNHRAGVLVFALGRSSYSWHQDSVDGLTNDSGTKSCR